MLSVTLPQRPPGVAKTNVVASPRPQESTKTSVVPGPRATVQAAAALKPPDPTSGVIRNLILDWSGTLADDLSAVVDATNHVFAHYGKKGLTRDEFRRHFRLPYSEFYGEFFPGEPMDDLSRIYYERFTAIQADVPLIEGAAAFLEHAKNTGRRLFLLSTIHPDHYTHQAARLEIGHFFEAAHVGIQDKRGALGRMLDRYGLIPHQTAFIGDMVHDIEAARAGGVKAIAVMSGFDPADKLLAARPDLMAGSLGELRAFIPPPSTPTTFPVSTVGALIYDSMDRVLMLQTHKWGNRWGIPGGKIQRGESNEEAVRREVREETALELDDLQFALVQDCIDSGEFVTPAHFLLLNYVALARPGEVTLNDEAQRFMWVPPEEALAMNLNTPTRVLLEWAMTRQQQH
jgi:phosphoglycolate phosphatase